MFASAAKSAARHAVTSHLAGASSLTTRFSALAIRPIAVRSFSVYQSPLLAARVSALSKKTTKKKATKKTTKKTTKKAAAKKDAPEPKKKVVRVKKELTPEQAEKADIRRLKKQALWNQEPPAGNGSGWAVFISEQMANRKLEDITLAERMHALRDQWAGLSDYDKERYKSQAEVLAEQRKKARKDWIETIPAEEIHLANLARGTLVRKYNKKSPKLHDERIPKRPMSAFSRFFISWFNTAPERKADVAAKDRFGIAAAKWKTMSEADKAPYVSEYSGAKEQYDQQNAGFRKDVEKLRKISYRASASASTSAGTSASTSASGSP